MMRVSTLLCGMMCIGADLARAESASPKPLLETIVVDYSADQNIVGLAKGGHHGVAAGDRLWVFETDGTARGGRVLDLSPEKSTGKLDKAAPAIKVGVPALILREAFLSSLRDQQPPGVTIRGRIARVAPGQNSAWIESDGMAGLRLGDQMLITRAGTPVARGRLVILEPDAILTTLEALVGNAITESDDSIELWPAPADARWGRLNSTVLKVEHPAHSRTDDEAKEALITIAGSAEDGLSKDRQVDVMRGRTFVGVAVVTEVSSPVSKAKMQPAATTRTLSKEQDEGDAAVVRAPAGPQPSPLVVPVFQVGRDYCLIAAGETEGILVHEKFIVRRPDPADAMILREIAELTVEAVKVDYSGANVRPLVPGGKVQLWDMAERRLGAEHLPQGVGIVETVDPEGRLAVGSVDSAIRLPAGGVIGWVPESDKPAGGGVVLRQMETRVTFWVPPGWGAVEDLPRARIEAPRLLLMSASASSRPS